MTSTVVPSPHEIEKQVRKWADLEVERDGSRRDVEDVVDSLKRIVLEANRTIEEYGVEDDDDDE